MEGQWKSYIVIYQKGTISLKAIYVLMVNVLHDIQGYCFAMGDMQVVSHPSYQMIFEDSFDELVQKVRCKKFVDVCKGNLTDLWRILHLSLAKGNPK
jgi:hypothetical protein